MPKIGVSLYDPSQIYEIAHENNVDVIQVPASAIDQRILQGDIISFCKKKNIEIHIRSVFLQGALLNSKNYPATSPNGEPCLKLGKHG